MTSPRTARGFFVAALRCAVGAALLAVPSLATNGDPGRAVLVRTIGIRDLVVGAGALTALRRDPLTARPWVQSGLVSDVADVLLALGSYRQLGARGTFIAAVAPLPFIAAVSCSRPWRRPSGPAT
jgi:hypothetical protein